MEVLQTAQCFDTVAGMPQFLYTKVIHRLGDTLYCSRTSQRMPAGSQKIDPANLIDTITIPINECYPRYTTDLTEAPNPLPPDCYIKRPNLMAYGQGLEIHQLVLQDVQACEMLKRHPHKNLASYLGCEVSEGRVIGLCFQKYHDTLMGRINPGSLSKQQNSYCNATASVLYLPAIKSGINHIHSLGYVHNDINPQNIMFDDDDNPVIIDFDSCLPSGATLATAKRTPGWHDPGVQTSDPKNDWDAILEIGAWLSGSTDDYRFQGF